MAGDTLAVQLEHEVRGPELYGPAGYRWTPRAGDRVLVIKGGRERACIVGVKQGRIPARVSLEAESVELNGNLLVNGIGLEEYIGQIVRQAMGGTE